MTEPGHGGTLTERQASILRAVCRHYIVHGDEVASRALARAHGFRCSSATLRQELAALEREGLVSRPHRSAGCTPTTQGLAQYVEALQSTPSEARVDPTIAQAVDRSLRDLRGSPQQGMRAAVCVLSDVSGCLAVTFVGGSASDRVRTVELVPLVGERMLAVVEMEGGATHMVTVGIDALSAESMIAAARADESPREGDGPRDETPDLEGIDGIESIDGIEAIERLRTELRRLCAGKTLPEAREEVLRRIGEHEARVDRILAHALALGLLLSSVGPLDPLWLQAAGGSALALGGVDATQLSDVLGLLEDDQRLAEVLSQLVGEAGPGEQPRAHVHLGAGALLRASSDASRTTGPHPVVTPSSTPQRCLTLVGCPVPLPRSEAGQAVQRGAVALIGPDRMDYAAVIPLVEYAARALGATLDA